MPYLMQKMDKVQAKFSAVTGMKLSLRASEYIKRQVFATFIDDDLVVDVLRHYGPDNIMWSSDYPHTAATFPHSQEFVQKLLGTVPEQSRRKVVRETAARLYGLG
jgi:predicted TIM-barrel fold metal-dependent hydrolase